MLCEYFCRSCRQLRLYARDGTPEHCGNCGSKKIVVDEVDSERLSAMRWPKSEKKQGDQMDIDTMNKFIVGSQDNGIVIVNPPRGPISPEDALLLAAYLVLMAEHDAAHTFEQVTEAVKSA
jgi:hypothetical protein